MSLQVCCLSQSRVLTDKMDSLPVIDIHVGDHFLKVQDWNRLIPKSFQSSRLYPNKEVSEIAVLFDTLHVNLIWRFSRKHLLEGSTLGSFD